MLTLKRILHPTDFSDGSNRALKYACSLATQFNTELHLINVVHDAGLISPPISGFIPPDYYKQQIQYATEELAALPEKVLSHSGSVVRNVCEGIPFVQIIRYAKEHAIDMIVMGTHGYTGVKHMIMGSVAENVVRKAPCPVLTIRAENHEFVMP